MTELLTLTVHDKEAVRSLDILADPKTHGQALYAAGVHFQGLVAPYPSSRPHPSRKSIYGTTFQTAKQRRAVMAMIRRGAIIVPYRRGQAAQSENMLQRWKTTLSTDQRSVTVGNTASYAQKVIGLQKKQSLYMRKLGWQSMEEQYKKHKQELPRIYMKIVSQKVRGQ